MVVQIPSEDLHIYFDKLAAKYGAVYTLYLPTPHVMLTRHEDIRRCLVGKGGLVVGTAFILQ